MQDVANGVAMPYEILNILKDHLEDTTGNISNQKIEEIYKALTAPKEKLPYQVTSALLIPDQAKGLTEVSKEKKVSLQDRVDFAKDLVSNDNDNWILWHHREDERALIQKAFGPECKSVFGSQDEEQREDYLMEYKQMTPTLFDVLEEVEG